MQEITSPLAYTIPGAVKASGLSRTRLYAMMGEGTIEARKVGRRTLITADSLRACLAALPPATIRAPKAA